MKYDLMVVGAGLTGAVIAERAAAKGLSVLVIDKRPFIGGNCADGYNEHGILTHFRGPHCLHANSPELWEYLSRFTEWHHYEARSVAYVDGMYVPIPINRTTINKIYGLNLSSEGVKEFLESIREDRPKITSEDAVIGKVGRDLYDKFFKNYTYKQWGMDASELDYSVCARIPVYTDADDRYFRDQFQGIPKKGYTKMFENILDSKRIRVLLQCDFFEDIGPQHWENYANTLVYTGCVDRWFNYKYGRLGWRSLEFKSITGPKEEMQQYPVVNWPNTGNFTRSSNYTKITGQQHHLSTVIYEYPKAEGEEYYPIPTQANKVLYEKYKAETLALNNVYFVGRLAEAAYKNMDQAVAASLKTAATMFGLNSWKEVL